MSLLSLLVGLVLLVIGTYVLLSELAFIQWSIPYVDDFRIYLLSAGMLIGGLLLVLGQLKSHK